MRKPQHPSSFSDIKPILDAALAAGGGRYRPRNPEGVPSEAAAHRFRHRAYAFRRAIQALSLQEGLGLTPVTTPYDSMVLRIDPEDPTVVLINKPDPQGDLMGLDGEPLILGTPPASASSDHEDPLVNEARRQAKELGIEL